ncbi:MAG: DNA topoisomerase IV subunit A [Sulfuricella sp.]|nr:DNA topoisomerase IV subunit A [Sulfuricella sp.]
MKPPDDPLTLDLFGEGVTLAEPPHVEAAPPAAAPAAPVAPFHRDVALGDAPAVPPGPPSPPAPPEDDGDGVYLPSFAERAYLAYAMSVVKSRALPSVQDGMKPVQRRILYAMRELGNRHDSPYKKSARIVGDVIGKFHPHGDSSVYDAAVRMAQDFSLRYPLIDGQGNFGSRDGDGAAAMRYTEVRLSKFAEEILLSELDKGTVDFSDNYDGSFLEPTLLSARLPVLLLNGASGIAVGMATNIPSHNLREVAAACKLVVSDPTVSNEAILDCVPGPDFPCGGHIISSDEEIRRAYESGRGSIRVRAVWSVEQLARGQWQAVITGLPSETSTAKFLAEIEELTNPKIKSGKKTLTPEQQAMKAKILSVLESVRDDSDQEHRVRIIIEPRSSRQTPDEMMAVLLANTSLESNEAMNMVVIGLDGKPQQKGLAQVVREWATFRMVAVERRLRHRLQDVDKRIHILEGRMIAFLNIEDVIRTIRESDEPKAALIAKFQLSEQQAEDILEIRLRQLARLEGIKIERELANLKEEKAGIHHLLDNEGARRKLVFDEIAGDAAKYGDARRTLIQAAEKITASKVEAVADEPITIILSKNGFIRCRTGHGIDKSTLSWKDGDGELSIAETRTVHPVILLDALGRAYNVKATDIPGGKGDGAPVASLVDLQSSRIVAMVCAAAENKILVATSGGYGFVAKVGDMATRQKAGKEFLRVEAGEFVLTPHLVGAATHVLAFSAKGKLSLFDLGEVKELPKGRGVILMAVEDKDSLSVALPVVAGEGIAFLTKRGEKVIAWAQLETDFMNRRARKGRIAPGILKR